MKCSNNHLQVVQKVTIIATIAAKDLKGLFAVEP